MRAGSRRRCVGAGWMQRAAVVAVVGLALVRPGAHPPPLAHPLPLAQLAQPRPTPPLFAFEENRGQLDPRVRYAARKGARAAFATDDGVTLVDRTPRTSAAVRLRLAGARRAAPEPEAKQGGIVSYFRGRDPSRWQTHLSTFGQLRYRDAYPGIDAVYYGAPSGIEYDLVVRPGADPRAIEVTLEGADSVSVSDEGDVDIRVGEHRFAMKRPVAFQGDGEGDGEGLARAHVASRFVATGERSLAIAVADYDRTKTLVIDPVFVWASYVGGAALEVVDYGSLDVDPAGNVLVAGYTSSLDLPVTLGAFDTALSGDSDVMVAKLKPDGTGLVYCAYLGGTANEDVKDRVRPIAADASGSAYVTGRTNSVDFPTTTGAFATSYQGGLTDAFVTKLSPAGDALVYSTYLGGDDGDFGYDILVDGAGSAYVGGHTRSTNFPTSAGAAGATGGGFVTKLTPAGDAIVYSTHIEGGITYVLAIARDAAGNVYATGQADTGFVPTVGALQTTHLGETYDAFVTKISPSGTQYLYSTLLGGTGDEGGYAIAVDAAGNAVVGGRTGSTDFPTTAGAIRKTLGPPTDAFVTKLSAAGNALVYSTLLGRDGDDGVLGLALDAAGTTWVSGTTGPGWASKNGCLPAPSVEGAGFVTELSPTGQLGAFSTIMPASVTALARSAQGSLVGLCSVTAETGRAVTGSFDVTHDGEGDAFVFQLSPVAESGLPGCQPCNGDHGSAATRACPDAARPVCRLAGIGAGTCVPREVASTDAGGAPDAAAPSDAGAAAGDDAGAGAAAPSSPPSEGCSCRTTAATSGARSPSTAFALAALVPIALATRRRRRASAR